MPFLYLVDVSQRTSRAILLLVGATLLVVLQVTSCNNDDPVFEALNDEDNCVVVDVVEGDDDDTVGDDDDSVDDDDSAAGDDDDSAAGDDDDTIGDDDSVGDDDTVGDDDSAAPTDDDDSAARDGRADDDDSADDEDIYPGAVVTDLTCCGGSTVIGQALVDPETGPAGDGEERYVAVMIDADAFEANGFDIDDVVRVTVSYDSQGVGEGEIELEQDGLQDTLWDGWIGCGTLGGVPRTDQLCFHLWGEEESSE
jgi:hypothetical protein